MARRVLESSSIRISRRVSMLSRRGRYSTASTPSTTSIAARITTPQATRALPLRRWPKPLTTPFKANCRIRLRIRRRDPQVGRPVRTWLDSELTAYLASLGVSSGDGGIAAGKAAAAAAIAARAIDNAAPVSTYGAQLTPTANPGVGLWRQSNAGSPYVNPVTGAPTGFDATGSVIQGKPGIDWNWRDVTPFSLSTPQKNALIDAVPLSPIVGSPEYNAELAYVKQYGQDTSTARSADQTAQALYYKPRTSKSSSTRPPASRQAARGLSLDKNAALFALLDNAIADARVAAFASKYDRKFWRPITAANADAEGNVTNNYAAWHPLAATPSHPSNTAGHSTTGAAGFEILRLYFGQDTVNPNGSAATLGTLPWLVGTNDGTGNAVNRSVSTFTQAQLENGASRIYLGVHFGFDNLQGQLLGLAVADTIVAQSNDPAAQGVHWTAAPATVSALTSSLFSALAARLLANTKVYGYFGASPTLP